MNHKPSLPLLLFAVITLIAGAVYWQTGTADARGILVKDIATFEAEGHVWEDVQLLSCAYLRNIPDGPSIPPEAGPSPSP